MSKTSVEKLADEMEDVFEDVAHSLKKLVKHFSDQAGDTLSSAAVSTAHAAMDLVEEAKTQSRSLTERAVGEVRDHPRATAAVAAAGVALIGLAIALRARDPA